MYFMPHNGFIKSTNRSENDMANATHLVYWTTAYGDYAVAAKRTDGVWFNRYSSVGRFGPQMGKWGMVSKEDSECYENIINRIGDGRVGFNKANFLTDEKEKIAVRLPKI